MAWMDVRAYQDAHSPETIEMRGAHARRTSSAS